MTQGCSQRFARWALAAAIVAGAASSAAATCEQVDQLLARGLSITQVAVALGAPIGAVQACLQPLSTGSAAGPAPFGAAGPAPFGAAGPAPFHAAGAAPFGAGGPAPLGAAGPAPLGAAGPAPAASNPSKTR
jgi:hypothetical protein